MRAVVEKMEQITALASNPTEIVRRSESKHERVCADPTRCKMTDYEGVDIGDKKLHATLSIVQGGPAMWQWRIDATRQLHDALPRTPTIMSGNLHLSRVTSGSMSGAVVEFSPLPGSDAGELRVSTAAYLVRTDDVELPVFRENKLVP